MQNSNRNVLVTGAAGFIGFHLCKRLLDDGFVVAGMDNMNDYYDASLKEARLAILQEYKGFNFTLLDLADQQGMEDLFSKTKPSIVVHLAAQAGVRYSVTNPHIYIKSNIDGFLNVLEGCRHHKVDHFVFASSSSVYGLNTKMPFSEKDHTDHPVSLYGATKKANEMMAHSYSHLYGIPTTGLRFFTVYGPWGRPDMAYFSFTKAILEGKPIRLFNHGKMKRDFTYVDDIVEGVVRIMSRPAKPNPNWSGEMPDPSSSSVPYRIYNIGNNKPVELGRFVEILEECLGIKAIKEFYPLQQGDVVETFADIDSLYQAVGFQPKISLEVGLVKFVGWYKSLNNDTRDIDYSFLH